MFVTIPLNDKPETDPKVELDALYLIVIAVRQQRPLLFTEDESKRIACFYFKQWNSPKGIQLFIAYRVKSEFVEIYHHFVSIHFKTECYPHHWPLLLFH